MKLAEVENKEMVLSVENLFERLKIRLKDKMLPKEKLDVLLHDDFVEVEFDLSSQIMLENLIDIIASDTDFHVLIAYKSHSNRDYRAVVFSTPAQGSMFVLTMSSHEYGVVDTIIAKVYDDIETMYLSLRKELSLNIKDNIIIEKQKLGNVINIFNS